MKKILLIKPDYNYFPIGMAYVAGALKKKGIAYDFIDMHLNPEPDFKSILEENDYLAVTSGGLLGSYTFFKHLFSKIKEINHDMPCILGGNITTVTDTELLLTNIPVDILIIGEGEISFPELLIQMDKGDNYFYDIASLICRDPKEEKGYYKTKRRKQLDLVETNWMPDWDFFDIKSYGFLTMPLLTGRGCTGRCSFCSPTNGGFRGRPIEHIIEEIKILYSKYDFVHLVFMNEIFFPDEESITEFCQEYKKIKPERHWHCLMRMDINPDVLYTMRDAGCILMNVGVESGSNKVLQNIKKDITIDDTRKFIKAAKEADVVTQASFMMANYGENEEDIVKTVDLMLDLEISGPMALTINYPGTLNYHRARKRKLIIDEKKYIESLDLLYSKNYFQVISGHLSGKLSYLNLSSMDDKTLFKVVEREMRRFQTEGFRIRNVKLSKSKVHKGMNFSGYCPFCRNHVELDVDEKYMHPLNFRLNCSKCGEREIYFSPLEIRSYKNYYDEKIINELQSSDRPFIIAGFEEARIFLMFDMLGVDYSKIQGFVAHKGMPEGFVLNYPIIPVENIDEKDPDLFIILSSIPHDLQQFVNRKKKKGELVKSVCLTPEAAFKRIKLNKEFIGKKNLIISSGPLELLTIFFNTVNEADCLMENDLLIQKSRYFQLNDTYDCKVHFIPDGMITMSGFDKTLLKQLQASSYDTVIFLSNNNNILGYQEIRNISASINPKQIMAFPLANIHEELNDMHLLVL